MTCRGLLVAAVACAMPAATYAGNNWDGGGTSPYNWNDPLNWTGDSLPGYGTLTFGDNGNVGTTNTHNYSLSQNMLLWKGASGWTINRASSAVISLFDNGGVQAKIENQSSGLVTLNTVVTFAATSGAAWGEINAVNGDLTFGSNSVLTVNGSQVAGIRMFGSSRTTEFNGTTNAASKYFATVSTDETVRVGGTFTSGDFYVMNNSVLEVAGGGVLSAADVRLGGDFGTTGLQNLAAGASLALSNTGNATVNSRINTVAGNTSNALSIGSLNNTGTNTIAGAIFLDRPLTIQQFFAGTLNVTSTRTGPSDFANGIDIKGNRLTLNSGGTLNVSGTIYNSSGTGEVYSGGTGVVILSNANAYAGPTVITGGTLRADGGNPINSATGSGTVTVNSGGTLAGSGRISGPVVVNSGAVITSGSGATADDSIESLDTGNQTWNTGGTWAVKFKSNAPSNAINADLLNMNLLSISSGFKLTLLKTTTGTFTIGSPKTYQIATTGAITTGSATATAFNPAVMAGTVTGEKNLTSLFVLNSDGLSNIDESHFKVFSGSDGYGLFLQYDGGGIQPAPEPATAGLIGMATVAVLGARRGRRRVD